MNNENRRVKAFLMPVWRIFHYALIVLPSEMCRQLQPTHSKIFHSDGSANTSQSYWATDTVLQVCLQTSMMSQDLPWWKATVLWTWFGSILQYILLFLSYPLSTSRSLCRLPEDLKLFNECYLEVCLRRLWFPKNQHSFPIVQSPNSPLSICWKGMCEQSHTCPSITDILH